ncbi:uncharacterized protein wu:fj16a03 [Thunnus thynnus]|uniref:uncharacterized protein wu:fj16a03 n=1 Tax=Thunnus maccoyii TaxID=8240 RepID=UPI001C4C48B0|nr:uncharacterized protein wu:fj16a03 [Thunnus maccoyii]XP_042288608.1 uncharacterized protein wu:fj16a03 [Thunnus maccoyii]XP_042288609.1 uncharacterized protein wu:fj16a03 [Thunnus maccoyii]XP_042288610.1 uncharacterized protein wu:fj16a03 [Thunnus maccoyii]XP_042288611.1 uncharacterized protein wu:fj16a03 [Thunnus maccoyii]
MKCYLLLLLLLPLCSGAQKFHIECYGQDFLMVDNMLLQCSSKVQQACYTKDNGEKGCTRLEFCSRPGWSCCHTSRCNA